MIRIAIVSAACAFAMAVSATVSAEEPTEEMAAKDAAVVQACLDVAEAKRKAADAAEADSSGDDAQKEKKTGPEGHLEVAAREAGYAPESCIGVLSGPCMETEEGASTYGMMDCYGRESEVWDARLNASYREQLAPEFRPGGQCRDRSDGGEAVAQSANRLDPLAGRDLRGALCGRDSDLWFVGQRRCGPLHHGAHSAPGALDGGAFNTGFRMTAPEVPR